MKKVPAQQTAIEEAELDLPEGWTHITLGVAVESMKNGLYKPANAYADHGVACLRMYNIEDGKIIWKDIKRMILSTDEVDEYRLLPGNLLVNRVNSRELVGKTAMIPEGLETCVFESKNIRVRLINELVNSAFVSYQLFLSGQRHFNFNSQQVVGMASISQPQIADFPLPLPPRFEQDRIVSKVQALSAEIDKSRERLAKVPNILKAFRQSVLAAACSGRLTEEWREKHAGVEAASVSIEKLKKAIGTRVRRGVPESVPQTEIVAGWQLPETWGCYSAAELLRCGAFTDVKDGNHGANHPKVSDFTDTGLSFITAAQVNNFRVDYDGAYKLSGKPLDRIRVGLAKAGDIIYTHKGSVGRVAIADRDCVLTPQTTYYRLSPKVFANGFLMFYLASRAFSEQVDVVKEQTTRDFVPISEQYLFFHRVPPLPEQHEIVRRVETLFILADKIEERVAAATKRADKLTRAILAKAFRGELVPTEAELARQEGRDYEPASVLLARIKSEREKAASPNGTRRRNATGINVRV